jgi:hypothetical protein
MDLYAGQENKHEDKDDGGDLPGSRIGAMIPNFHQ